MSLRARIVTLGLRLFTKPRLAKMTDPAELRDVMERFTRIALRPAPGSVAMPLDLAGRAALSIRAGVPRDGAAVVHFHGGVFIAGSPQTHLPMLSRLAKLARVTVIAPSYRLAPEHPFPAALRDAEAVWEALIAQGYRPENLVLSGDSAGAALAFALLSKLCAEGTPPAGAFAFSPWFDLTGASPSVRANAAADPMLAGHRLPEAAQFYLQGHPADDPEASPIFAPFPGCPPVLLQSAETEILSDDALRMEEKLRHAGADVLLQLWPGVPHAWQMMDGLIPEAREALRDAARFVTRVLTAPPQRSDGS
ncbi:alpha/beta hydrolase [Rhodobacter capsulatus]|uniref:alpha/beta hydrolase n=1 Tax=Rhodobacter capsulatus TaxID=1061 RepID=UPI0003D2E922|nr:alpha/beta hydrolase [Rhodobacter capsulatus]ETD83618.1 alpha/beta hydrolase [Rhodobacter capsulatus YW1]